MGNYFDVVGFQKIDYVSKRTNRPVNGYKLFLCYEDSRITGFGCIDVFVNVDRINREPTVNDICQVYYNRFGSVESVILEDSKERGKQ